MMMEKYVTVTKYSFSMDGDTFAKGYLVSDEENRGGRLFRLGSVRFENESPIAEGDFVDARMEGEATDGRLMFQKGRFVLSLRDRSAYKLPEVNEARIG